ncbi:hypothetical protein [Maribacter sp. LLG6340-A2]|uniref:hypothetical protein n=1 Tax=Maribacter sp. LLG6340-A2 TaxID=3160834 RepID=UPI00386A309C
MEKSPNIEGKTTAIVAYLTIVGALIALSMNAEPKYKFARFHTRQAFGLHIIFLAFALLNSQWGNVYGFYGLYIFYTVLWFYGFLGVLGNKEQEIPFLGPYFQKWFTFIQ